VVIKLRLFGLDAPPTLIHSIGNATALSGYSIAALGLQPYVNALIVITLVRAVSKSVQAIAKSPDGMHQLSRWTRALTILFAMGQAYGLTVLYQQGDYLPALAPMDWFARLVLILELTGGTMVLVLLGDVLDEFGLGFGNGAILIYALSSVAGEVHRLAAMVSPYSSTDALYRPLAVWIVFSIGVVAASVAVLLAIRRLPPAGGKRSRKDKAVELRILLSGVLRPPIFASAVLFLPVILTQSNVLASAWVADHVTAYGTNPWTDGAYAIFHFSLVVGFTYFVVACDSGGLPAGVVNRLTFIGGSFLAFVVVVVPILEWNATRAAGMVIPMSGFDVVLVTTMIVFVVRSLEQSRKLVTGPPLLMSPVP
jgi:preprotein translocase subunit SecY